MVDNNIQALKEQGNEQFKLRNFEAAKNLYSDAIFNLEISTAPSSNPFSPNEATSNSDDNIKENSNTEIKENLNQEKSNESIPSSNETGEKPEGEKPEEEKPELTPEQKEANYFKATLYANRSACFKELGDVDNCLADADHALALHTPYPKVRMRRFWALRKKGKANDALNEIKKAIEEDPLIEYDYAKEYRDVQKEAAEETEKLKKEAIGTLKDLGNKFLGLFGMSLDNFQMQQNADGGYNIQFKQ